MNPTRYLGLIATIVATVLLCAATAYSGDIKARMKARLPEIIELKAAGLIGEDNQGFLAFVSGKKEAAELVEAENADRRQVYAAIARQQGTDAATVGQRRALQIAEKANPGEWLQDAQGKWHRK